jgi:hypothetical protein
MLVKDLPAAPDDEHSTELSRILSSPAKPAAWDSPQASNPDGGPHHLAPRRNPHARRPIALPPPIDNQIEWEVLFTLESGRLFGRAHADGDNCCAPRSELPISVAQLLDDLATEWSAVVPQPHDHNGIVPPQITEKDGRSVRRWERDVPQTVQIDHLRILLSKELYKEKYRYS